MTATRQKQQRYRDNLRAEIDSAAIYRALAEIEANEAVAGIYARMAEAEERHARFWLRKLAAGGAAAAMPAPSGRARALIWIARRLGPAWVLPIIAGGESADLRAYSRQPEARETSLPAEERYHHRLIHAILSRTRGGLSGDSVARLEGRHRTIGGNALRAAVLGGNDGLVSNLSLVMGVAGAALAAETILLAGLAGLLAGAISMALGEWLSVQSARELHQRQLEIEALELEEHPQEEAAELALIYQAKGLPPAQARQLADRLVADPAKALDALAREELGINPEDLGGSAWVAAGISFLLFAAGAAVPVVPFLLLDGAEAILASAAASGIALFGIGAAISLLTGRGALFCGVRQLTFGLAAAALTYGIGAALGVAIHG